MSPKSLSQCLFHCISHKMNHKWISRQLLSTFDISDELMAKLSLNGFKYKSEIERISDSELISKCGLTEEEMVSINEDIKNSHQKPFELKTVLELYGIKGETISTGCKAFDRVLNDGILVSRLTQICGEGGSGKTQICMQLCLNVQLPQECGGLSGEALYIDTEDNFRPERLSSMTDHCLQKYTNLSETFTFDYIKSKIHLKTCNTNAQQLFQIINDQIEPFIEKNPKIRLVVIDSIAHLFRYDYKGTNEEKGYQLAQIANKLRRLAHFKKVAVLITNQVSFNPEECRDRPSLGDQWQTVCSTNLMIERNDGSHGNPRKGTFLKSMSDESNQFYFCVTEKGIQDNC